jgi:hypothetical protein
VLTGSTLPPASPHRAAVKRVTAPARTRAARVVGHLLGWAGSPGRGLAGFPAGRAWQAAVPPPMGRFRLCAAGRGPV